MQQLLNVVFIVSIYASFAIGFTLERSPRRTLKPIFMPL